MNFKSILQYEMFFWAIIMILVSSYTVYYGWQEKEGIENLYIYGCPGYDINPMATCAEEDKLVVGLEVDHEYNFQTNTDSGIIYDPYGHYARKKRITYYIMAVIIVLGSLAVFKLYRFVKSRPKIIEYFKRRMKEHEEKKE